MEVSKRIVSRVDMNIHLAKKVYKYEYRGDGDEVKPPRLVPITSGNHIVMMPYKTPLLPPTIIYVAKFCFSQATFVPATLYAMLKINGNVLASIIIGVCVKVRLS